jgi:hypothetical protein
MKVTLKRTMTAGSGKFVQRFRKGYHENFPDSFADFLPKDAEVHEKAPEVKPAPEPSLDDFDTVKQSMDEEARIQQAASEAFEAAKKARQDARRKKHLKK